MLGSNCFAADPFLTVTLGGLTPLREPQHGRARAGEGTAMIEERHSPTSNGIRSPHLPASAEFPLSVLGGAGDIFQVFNKELCTHVHCTAENFCNYSNSDETTSALSLPSSRCFSLCSLLVISHSNCKKCFVQNTNSLFRMPLCYQQEQHFK